MIFDVWLAGRILLTQGIPGDLRRYENGRERLTKCQIDPNSRDSNSKISKGHWLSNLHLEGNMYHHCHIVSLYHLSVLQVVLSNISIYFSSPSCTGSAHQHLSAAIRSTSSKNEAHEISRAYYNWSLFDFRMVPSKLGQRDVWMESWIESETISAQDLCNLS